MYLSVNGESVPCRRVGKRGSMSDFNAFDIGQHYIDLRTGGVPDKEIGRHLRRFIHCNAIPQENGDDGIDMCTNNIEINVEQEGNDYE